MLTSKQRAKLRGIASDYETILQVGKGGITPTLVEGVEGAIHKRELIKIRVLNNAPIDAREAAVTLAEAVGAEVVAVIGTRFILFRRNKKNPVVRF